MKIKFIQNAIDKIRGKKKKEKPAPRLPINWEDLDNYENNIKEAFKRCFGYELDLDNPKTFSEKMQWIRVFDNTPLKTKLADKYECREYVKEMIGEEYLVPLLGVYDSFDDIDFDGLPNQFVLKCNHGCGYNIIVKDKAVFDKEEAKTKINTWMNENYAIKFGEIHYKDIKPRIIIEKYLEEICGDISDYKYYCLNGKPHYIHYCTDRKSGVLKNSFFDLNLKNQYVDNTGILYDGEVEKPANLVLMNTLAERLSQHFKCVRIDFYNINGKIYFGEFTFTPFGCYFKFNPKEWDLKLGNLLNLD